jgi:transcription antitermination factor NusG
MARWAPGSAYFLGAGGNPEPVPAELVEAIRQRAEAIKQHGWGQPQLKKNDRVVIERGPLAGLSAIFDGHLSAAGRARVFVEMVRRLVPVDVDVAALSPALQRSTA